MTRRLSMQFVAASAAVLSLVLSASAEEPDLFVDYVTASEAQYVDTEIIGRSGTKAEIEVMWTGNPNSSTLLGSNGGASSYFRLLDNKKGTFGAAYGSSATTTSTTLTNNKGYVIVSDFQAGSQTVTANGAVVYNGTDAAECNSGKTMYIFAQNNNGGVNYYTKNVRLYQLKIWQDGVLVRHYLPCRKNAVYGLYDKISGRIFYSDSETALGGSGVPVDGYTWTVGDAVPAYNNNGCGYNDAKRSLYYRLANNGGVIRMAPGYKSATAKNVGFPYNMDQNIGGIDFTNTCWVVYSFTADKAMNFGMREPFINCDEMTYGGHIGPRLQIQGRDNNCFRKTGGGNLTLDDKPLARFLCVYVDDGLLATTSTAASVITECPVVLRGGGVSYKPNPVSGGAAAATMATGGFASANLYGSLAVAKGSNDSLALTLGGVNVSAGGLLSFDHTGGLGVTEKVFSTGRAEGDEPGVIVARDSTTGLYAFLEYSSANGFTPKSGSGNVRSGAALLLNTASADGFTGGAAVDFGASRGVVWKANTAATVDVKTAISGSGGVVFAGRRDASSPAVLAFYDGDWCGWSGGTVLAGVRAIMRGATPFPTDAPVEVVGQRRYGSSSLYFESTLVPANDFVVSGSGENGEGVVYAAADAAVTFAGTLSVTNVAVFGGDAGSSYAFSNPIEGSGTLELKSGAATFSCDNHHAATHVTGGALTLTGTGTFGGELRQSDGSVVFDASTAVVTGNVYSTDGTLSFANGSTTTLAGKGEIASLSVAAGCTVSISGRVKVNALNLADGASIVGAGGTLELYCASDVVLGSGSIAGGNALTVVKSGPGILTLPCGFATGCNLSVPEGELKLASGNLLVDATALVYHLDATQTETVMTDAAGAVTNWVSLVGNGVSFVDTEDAGTALPTSGVQTINGKAAVSFTGSGYTRLKANASLSQSTVFMVVKPGTFPSYSYTELFGKFGYDYGVRASNNHTHYWTQNLSTSSFTISDYRLGGVEIVSSATAAAEAFAAAPVQVLRFRCTSPNAGSAFVPSIGGFTVPTESHKKGFDGEIGEVIAFSRELTDDETKGVENYLAEKWGVNENGFHEGVVRIDERPSTLSAGSMDLGMGGVLDIGGASVTVDSLVGRGTIDNNAVLGIGSITAGTADFSGVIGENALLTAGGDLALGSTGGRVNVGSGTTTLSGYTYSIPQNGLLYHLDAAKPNSIVTNEAGGVTNWVSQSGSVASFLWREDWCVSGWNPSPPTYALSAINGKPAVSCNGAQALGSSSSVSVRTLFIAAKPIRKQANMSCLWGRRSGDAGLRYNGNGNGLAYAYNELLGVGSCKRVNGVLQTNPLSDTVLFDSTKLNPFVVVFAKDAAAAATAMNNALNLNANNRYGYHYFGEVIAYDRTLSNDEIVEIDNYLRKKWLTADPIAEQGVAPEVGGVVVTVDNAGKVVPAVVEGDLRLAEGASLSYTAAPVRQGATVLSVTGSVTGDFAEIARVKGMDTVREGNDWRLRCKGFFLIVR